MWLDVQNISITHERMVNGLSGGTSGGRVFSGSEVQRKKGKKDGPSRKCR